MRWSDRVEQEDTAADCSSGQQVKKSERTAEKTSKHQTGPEVGGEAVRWMMRGFNVPTWRHLNPPHDASPDSARTSFGCRDLLPFSHNRRTLWLSLHSPPSPHSL